MNSGKKSHQKHAPGLGHNSIESLKYDVT